MTPVLMPVYGRSEVAPVRGEGPHLFDADGRRWLDFASGIAVNALGHSHPHLVGAIQRQAALLMHTSNLYTLPGQQRLAERLTALTFADTVFFTNSGAEALEATLKTCLRWLDADGRSEAKVLTFSGAFHGRTLATISATDQPKVRNGFGTVLERFVTVPFDDLAAAEAAVNAGNIGAILVEPIQGESGIRPTSPAFLQGLRRLADDHNLLLAFDEVQSGIGRTGTLFAYEQYGVAPDVMAVGKGVGGGFPLGACLATANAASGMTAGMHGSTYGGNPLAMAAGEAVLDVVAEPAFLAQVRETSAILRGRLETLATEVPGLFLEVRGLGLMLGVKLNGDSRAFVAHARTYGLLTAAAGDNVVRILPPLIIEPQHIEEAIAKLGEAARTFPRAQAAA
ncbi:aspartate aminotransferase family protein [Caulobacter sp. S45]|uniref:aspartate aminotransferase family protein n=1 Tax=Caulobacter sp. S45 TaxID=1641861 RepID=UPI00131AF458|nr:aspartate aminotransferase family protein [Caulobacter sp. S45]